MAIGLRNDPYLTFNFLVEIEGLVVGGFSEVTGLQVEVEVKEYREGGVNEYIHKLAGPTRYPANLVLKHGLVDSAVLWTWVEDVTLGIVERKNLSIILLDSVGIEVQRWEFDSAYPVKWSGPDLRAERTEVAVETVEFAHRGLI